MDKQVKGETPMPSAEISPASDSRLKNWAGNLTYCASRIHYPKTLEEVQAVVQQCPKLRVVGSRHSFNAIADSQTDLLSVEALNKVVVLDKAANTITVEGGVRYGDIAPFLHENGYALPNLASLPHITVAGACATATHGSGAKNRSLASSVSALEFIDGRGEVVNLSREKNADIFDGVVVSLGALGVVTKLTLDLLPTFRMNQRVYLDLPMPVLQDHFAAIQDEGYSVSLFTNWQDKNIDEVWIKSIVGESFTPAPGELFGAKEAKANVHPIRGQSAENVTDQLGLPGAWYDRMPHFKMGFKPSAGTELQSEYFVAIENAYAAMMAIEPLHKKIAPLLYVSEIRTIAADEHWLSPFYRRQSVAFHFTWKQETAAVMSLLPLIEEQLAPFAPRPHWGKLFAFPPKHLQAQYAKLGDFRQLAQHYDPAGKFRNAFLHTYVFT